MKNNYLFGIGTALAISLTSITAFASTIPETSDALPPAVMATVAASPGLETGNTEHTMIHSMDWDAEDAYLLAKIAMAEAESEGVEGKALVMLVVLNRVWDESFPDSIAEVIFQKRQFSSIGDGRYDRVEPDEECYEALRLIQIGGWDESQGATYFESKSASAWHSENLTFLFQYENHYFYKE